MYVEMEWWTKIRLEVLRGEASKRAILSRENIHWETLKKILQYESSDTDCQFMKQIALPIFLLKRQAQQHGIALTFRFRSVHSED